MEYLLQVFAGTLFPKLVWLKIRCGFPGICDTGNIPRNKLIKIHCHLSVFNYSCNNNIMFKQVSCDISCHKSEKKQHTSKTPVPYNGNFIDIFPFGHYHVYASYYTMVFSPFRKYWRIWFSSFYFIKSLQVLQPFHWKREEKIRNFPFPDAYTP